MLIYYAHPISMYGSNQEFLDITFLTFAGLRVVNPAKLSKFAESVDDRMEYFCSLVKKCDCLAFRSFDDFKIGAGVMKEIRTMDSKGGMVIELRPRLFDRRLTVQQTRKRLIDSENQLGSAIYSGVYGDQ